MKTLVAFVLPIVTNCLQIGSKDYDRHEGSEQVITCKYDSAYEDNVKYWCRGYYRRSCSILCRTDHNSNSKVKIEDNRWGREITVTMHTLDTEDSGWYWCGIEISNWADVMDYTHITVTESEEATEENKSQEQYSCTTTTTTSTVPRSTRVQQMFYILIPLLCFAIPLFIVVAVVGRILIKKYSAGNNLRQPKQEGNTPAIVLTPPSDNGETSIMYADIVLHSKEKAIHSKTVPCKQTSQGDAGGTCGPVYSEILLQ